VLEMLRNSCPVFEIAMFRGVVNESEEKRGFCEE
jgi:hypothetical protein